jgi:hypothetical protein
MDLGGYEIYYGTDANALTNTIVISNPGDLIYVVDGLSVGRTYYFAVATLTSNGEESARSNVVSAKIS